MLEEVAEIVAGAVRPVLLTGAGMSADSGVPTFRDALTGLWARYDPSELATEAAFREHPARVFGWYVERLRTVWSITPHEGYRAVRELGRAWRDAPVITQNVDGLHRRVGHPDVIELHGSLTRFRCLDEGHPVELALVRRHIDGRTDADIDPPRCRFCDGLVRPGVVWFGEALNGHDVQRAADLVLAADVVLLVGTSSVVYPAASLPHLAKDGGACVIEVNPARTPFTERADRYWPARASVALPALAARARGGATDGRVTPR